MKVNGINGKQRTLKSAFIAGAVALSAGAGLAADGKCFEGGPASAIEMGDGTLYIGVDPDSLRFRVDPRSNQKVPVSFKALYTSEADEPGTFNAADAEMRCRQRGEDWRVPSIRQLEQLHLVRDSVGGLNKDFEGTRVPFMRASGMYLSSTRVDNGYNLRMSMDADGHRDEHFAERDYNSDSHLRCVRN